jgi:protein TonB
MPMNHHYSRFAFAKTVFALPFFVFFLLLNCNAQETNSDPSNSVKIEQNVKDEDPPMRFVTQFPEPVGGMDSVYKFIQENLRHPEVTLPKNKKNSNMVFVEFVIEKDGSISNVKVLVSIHPAYDEEAVRIIKMLHNWIPGKNKSQHERT